LGKRVGLPRRAGIGQRASTGSGASRSSRALSEFLAGPDEYGPDGALLQLYDETGLLDTAQLIRTVVLELKEVNATLRESRWRAAP